MNFGSLSNETSGWLRDSIRSAIYIQGVAFPSTPKENTWEYLLLLLLFLNKKVLQEMSKLKVTFSVRNSISTSNSMVQCFESMRNIIAFAKNHFQLNHYPKHSTLLKQKLKSRMIFLRQYRYYWNATGTFEKSYILICDQNITLRWIRSSKTRPTLILISWSWWPD